MLKNIFLLASLGLFLTACSTYSSRPHTTSRTTPVRAPIVAATLTAADVRMIRAYYAGANPGKARGRKDRLPPGIAKNLQRGKPLPPGIAKQYLPQYLLARLPGAGHGLEYAIVAGKLVLVEIATQIIRHILLDAVFD